MLDGSLRSKGFFRFGKPAVSKVVCLGTAWRNFTGSFPCASAMRQGSVVADMWPMSPLGLIARVKHLIRADSWCCVDHCLFSAAALTIRPFPYSFFIAGREMKIFIFVALLPVSIIAHGVRFFIFVRWRNLPRLLIFPQSGAVAVFILCTIVVIISVVASSFLATFGTKFQTSGVYGHVIAHAPPQECVLYQTCVVFVAALLHIYLRAVLCFPRSRFLSPNPCMCKNCVSILRSCKKKRRIIWNRFI